MYAKMFIVIWPRGSPYFSNRSAKSSLRTLTVATRTLSLASLNLLKVGFWRLNHTFPVISVESICGFCRYIHTPNLPF